MTPTQSPGRPRSFDEAEALSAAMRSFWAHGFAATNYEILEEATGLHRQSLRYAFGGKMALFEKALALYADTRVEQLAQLLKRPGSALDNVAAVFDEWLGDITTGQQNGCLMVNVSGELGRSEPSAAQAVNRATDKLRRAFGIAFARAQEQGEIDQSLDPEGLACLAMAAGDGALLHGRSSADATNSKTAFDTLLTLLR